MSAHLIELVAFGCYGPASARRRLWVPPGRALQVTRRDLMTVFINRVNDHEQVAFDLYGPGVPGGRRAGVLSLSCAELNFDVVARAIERDRHQRVQQVLIELINQQLAARAV